MERLQRGSKSSTEAPKRLQRGSIEALKRPKAEVPAVGDLLLVEALGEEGEEGGGGWRRVEEEEAPLHVEPLRGALLLPVEHVLLGLLEIFMGHLGTEGGLGLGKRR